jgi:lysophospholipase L1-like esterase
MDGRASGVQEGAADCPPPVELAHEKDTARAKGEGRFALLTGSLLLLLLLAAGEVAARKLTSPSHKLQEPRFKSSENSLFCFEPELGWFLSKNRSAWVDGSVRFWAAQNSAGFRDIEHDLSKHDKPRVVVLGDSYVWGFDVQDGERFTDLLREKVPEVEIFNCGVNGYGTAQEWLLYRKKARQYSPDLVVLVFSGNDRPNNLRVLEGPSERPVFRLRRGQLVPENLPVPEMSNEEIDQRQRGYAYRSHLIDAARYRINKLRLKWEPDPTEALVLELAKEVAADGARFMVVIGHRQQPELEKLFTERGIQCVPLHEVILSQDTPEAPVRYPHFGRHWTPRGHAIVAEALQPIIRKAALPSQEPS